MGAAAYHAYNQAQTTIQPAISTMLPLFPDESKSVAMIKHSMDVVQNAVDNVNRGQTPVIACGHTLYKIAKNIQWACLETHWEDSYVVMLGG